MLVLIRNFLLATVLTALVGVAAPAVRLSLYAARLACRPAPCHLGIPVDRVGAAALRDSWHAARPGGRRHEGIDIFAPRGTPVRSTTDGMVARVGRNRLGGQVVWVIGPGGQRHYYAHLARFGDVWPGQPVAAGAVLGYVGNSGNARGTPAHLHYGIYTASGPVDPYPLLWDGRGR